MRINSNEPLFIKTIKRFLGKNFNDITLVGNFEHRFLLKNFLDNYKIKYYKQNDPWNVERFLEDLLLVVKGQSNLDIDGYL